MCNTKSEKSSKYLPVHNLCVCTTLYLVLKTVESSVSDIKKALVKARIFTGTNILQKNQQTFSNGAVDAVCPRCGLKEEDLLHLLACCPEFYSILGLMVCTLNDIVISYTSVNIWNL